MLVVRKFIGRRRWGALLSISVAYALAIQALLASVGLGMSAVSASGQGDLVLCLHAPDSQPAIPDDRKLPNPQPQCPFCFAAAQSSLGVAAPSGAPPVPAHVGLRLSSRLAVANGDRAFVPHFRRTVGDPRAPPGFSV